MENAPSIEPGTRNSVSAMPLQNLHNQELQRQPNAHLLSLPNEIIEYILAEIPDRDVIFVQQVSSLRVADLVGCHPEYIIICAWNH